MPENAKDIDTTLDVVDNLDQPTQPTVDAKKPSPGYEFADEDGDMEVEIMEPEPTVIDDTFRAIYKDVDGHEVSEDVYNNLTDEFRWHEPEGPQPEKNLADEYVIIDEKDIEPEENKFEFENLDYGDFATDEEIDALKKEYGYEDDPAEDFEVMEQSDFEPANEVSPKKAKEKEDPQKKGEKVREPSFLERIFMPFVSLFMLMISDISDAFKAFSAPWTPNNEKEKAKEEPKPEKEGNLVDEFEVMEHSDFAPTNEVSANKSNEKETEHARPLFLSTEQEVEDMQKKGHNVREASFLEKIVEPFKTFFKSMVSDIAMIFRGGPEKWVPPSEKAKEASAAEKTGNLADEYEIIDSKDIEPKTNDLEFEVINKEDFEASGKFAPNDTDGKPNIDDPQIAQPENVQAGVSQSKIEPAMVKKTHVEAKEEVETEIKEDIAEHKAVNTEIKDNEPVEAEKKPNLSVKDQLKDAKSIDDVKNIAATTIVNVMESQSKEPFTAGDRSKLVTDTLNSPVFDNLTKGKSKDELSDYVASTGIVNDFATDTVEKTRNNLITKAATLVADERFNAKALPEEAKKMAINKVKTVDRAFASLTRGKSVQDLNKLVNGDNFMDEYKKAASNPDLQKAKVKSITGAVLKRPQTEEASRGLS